MKRILLSLASGAVLAGGAFASSAGASGPAAPGKHTVEAECEGLGTIMVSVPPSEQGKGAGQAVGQHLHGISVSNTFIAKDVTTNTLLIHETELRGRGHGHHNQATTTCKGIAFETEAANFFPEGQLPEGVSPTDIIRTEFEVQIVLKR